jgi:hypothetical protein
MPHIALLSPSSPEWTRTLHRAAHSGYHRPEYVVLDARRRGGRASAFHYREGDRRFLLPLVLCAIPGREERNDAATPDGFGGPVATDLDPEFWGRALRAMVRCLADHGVVSCFARLHPLLDVPHATLARFGAMVQHGQSVSVDLALSTAELQAQIRPGHRHEIDRARRTGHTVLVDEWQYLPDFVTAYAETMARVGADTSYRYDHGYFMGLVAAFRDRLHLLVVVDQDHTALGGGLFIETDHVVEYHLSGTRTAHVRQNPTKLMLDTAWRWAQSRGRPLLHLGLGAGRTDDPLLLFKAGFSKRRDPFYTYRLVTDSATYDELTRPLDGHGGSFFPAYRAPLPGPALSGGAPE